MRHRSSVRSARHAAGLAAVLALVTFQAPALAQWPAAGSAAGQLAPVTAAAADEMPIPATVQIPLLLKILTYDRNFGSRGQVEVRIGVVFEAGDPASVRARDALVAVLESYADKTVKRIPIRHRLIPYTSEAQFESLARGGGVNLIYVAPGNAGNLAGLLRVSENHRILTVTGVPDYVQRGVAVGIGIAQDKPQILINLQASKSAGSEFDVSLLRIAKVVR